MSALFYGFEVILAFLGFFEFFVQHVLEFFGGLVHQDFLVQALVADGDDLGIRHGIDGGNAHEITAGLMKFEVNLFFVWVAVSGHDSFAHYKIGVFL